jgi:hypothetical protein
MNVVYKEEDAMGKTQVILKFPAAQLFADMAKRYRLSTKEELRLRSIIPIKGFWYSHTSDNVRVNRKKGWALRVSRS